MQTSPSQTESFRAIVDVVLKVAEVHGSDVPIADLMELLPDGITPEQVALALDSIPGLSGRYELSEGLVMPKEAGASRLQEFKGRLDNSHAYLAVAKRFTTRLGPKGILMVAVSGSTSYRAASRFDDVDLFCITQPGELWTVLTKSLLLTRILGFNNRSAPPICLSCVMDEGYARGIFAKDQGALFARDALMAVAVRGDEEYRRLLGFASWMQRYFPRLYWQRSNPGQSLKNPPSSAHPLKRILNLFLFITVGTFIRTKTRYHNILLVRRGKSTAKFRAKVGPDHLIYESTRYLALKRTYGEIQPMSGLPQGLPPGINSVGPVLSSSGTR
jgi:hypothetical protein